MNPESPGPEPVDHGKPVPPGPEPTDQLPPAGPAPVTPGPAPTTPGRDPSTAWGGWLWGDSSGREARRVERHAQREARRAERGIGSAIWGVVLVLIGAGILASELIPGFDWDVAWPATLVAFGVLLIAASIRRAPAAS